MTARHSLYQLLLLAIPILPACTASETVESSAASRDLAQAIEDRRHLADSGRYLAAPSAAPGLAAVGDDLVASLDIPAALNPTFLSLVSPDPEAALVRTNMGHIQPRKGNTFLLLSTGRSGNDALTAEPGFDFAPVGPDGDVATLRFKVTVPPGRNRLSFDYAFLSAEAPEFVGVEFNDIFTARVSDATSANRQIASAEVNVAAFHPVSEVNVGPSPFLLYVDNPFGVDTEFNTGLQVDAGTTDFQRVDVLVASGEVTIEFDIRDAGDGFFDSAVIIDNLALSAIEVVDPHTDMVNDFGQVFPVPDPRLVTNGQPVHSVTADGATQVVIRSNVAGPGQVTFAVTSGLASDGTLSAASNTPTWGGTATVQAQLISGKWYAIALFRSPPDFNAAPADAAARHRDAQLTMTYTPPVGSGFVEPFAIGIDRPPVIVVPDIWSSCLSWQDHGSLMDPHPEMDPQLGVSHPFSVTCADYQPTSSKSFTVFENRSAVSSAIDQAMVLMRGTGVAVTRADVIGHGMGALLTRRYIDEFGFIAKDNFNAGRINRLILMNAQNLGARMNDELVRMRDDLKANLPANWDTLKDLLLMLDIKFDNADGDVALDEMMTASQTINDIGKNVSPPRSTYYHAIIGGDGRTIPWATGIGLVPSSVKTLYLNMENNHPKTRALAPPQRHRLIFGNQSFIFCDNAHATANDDHDLFATAWEQQGGLAAQFTTSFSVTPAGTLSGHFLTHDDKEHTEQLVDLLNAPVGGGLFATSMPSPSTVARENGCPMTIPFAPAVPPQALAARSIAITSPAPGTTVTPGRAITVAIDVGNTVPEAILIVTPGNAVVLEQPPFVTELTIPARAIGTARLRAVAFYGQGQMAFAPAVDLNVAINATLTSIEIVNGNAVLRRPGRTRQLTVVGNYSDGVRRDITRAAGTEYDASSLVVVASVSGTGLVTALAPGNATIAVRNGGIFTSINAKVGEPSCGDEVIDPDEQCDDGNTVPGDGCDASCRRENRPPVAVCDSPTRCNDPGACYAAVTDLGARSFDPDGDPLTIAQSPTSPYAVGRHAVSVIASDGALATQCVSQLGVLDCEPPSLRCPADFTKECTGQGGADVTPPPASALDNCSASVQSPAAGRRPLGPNALTYTAVDPAGNTTSCTTTVTVADTRPPVITCPAPIVAECKKNHSAPVTPGKAKSSDVCTAVTVTGPAAGNFPLGTTTVTYTSSDTTGHQASCTSTIQVVDTKPPLVSVGAPVVMGPPNHQYRTISLDECGIKVDDGCGGKLSPNAYRAQITCVTADEPDNAPGPDDGNTTADIVLIDSTTAKLRVERNAAGDGRIYKVGFRVQDESGNRTDGTCAFVVPREPDCPVGDNGAANTVCRP